MNNYQNQNYQNQNLSIYACKGDVCKQIPFGRWDIENYESEPTNDANRYNNIYYGVLTKNTSNFMLCVDGKSYKDKIWISIRFDDDKKLFLLSNVYPDDINISVYMSEQAKQVSQSFQGNTTALSFQDNDMAVTLNLLALYGKDTPKALFCFMPSIVLKVIDNPSESVSAYDGVWYGMLERNDSCPQQDYKYLPNTVVVLRYVGSKMSDNPNVPISYMDQIYNLSNLYKGEQLNINISVNFLVFLKNGKNPLTFLKNGTAIVDLYMINFPNSQCYKNLSLYLGKPDVIPLAIEGPNADFFINKAYVGQLEQKCGFDNSGQSALNPGQFMVLRFIREIGNGKFEFLLQPTDPRQKDKQSYLRNTIGYDYNSTNNVLYFNSNFTSVEVDLKKVAIGLGNCGVLTLTSNTCGTRGLPYNDGKGNMGCNNCTPGWRTCGSDNFCTQRSVGHNKACNNNCECGGDLNCHTLNIAGGNYNKCQKGKDFDWEQFSIDMAKLLKIVGPAETSASAANPYGQCGPHAFFYNDYSDCEIQTPDNPLPFTG